MNLVPPPSSGGSSVIRRIQRGTFSTNTGVDTDEIILNGFTDLDKMVVILNSSTLSVGNPAFCKNLTLNKLTIGCFSKTTGSYQVIEFY